MAPPTLRVTLAASPLYCLVCLAVLMLCCASIALMPERLANVGAAWQWLALLSVTMALGLAVSRHGLRYGAAAIKAVAHDGEGWWITQASGRYQSAVPDAEGVLLSYCVVQRFTLATGRLVTLVVLPDSAPADEFRRLRVRLGFTGTVGDPADLGDVEKP